MRKTDCEEDFIKDIFCIYEDTCDMLAKFTGEE